MNPKGISSNKDKHSNNSSSGSRNSSGINCVDEGATVQAGGPLPRGPSGPLKLECISISSDSEDGGGNTTLSPRRVLFPSESIICSSNNKASSSSIERKSSNGGAKDPPVLLIDSEDDSDYKRDVLAVIDSDEEPVNSPSISRAEPLAGRALSAVLPSGDAVQGDSCEFDFPCIYALFAEYNDRFFGGRLAHVEVKWSTKMTLCAGLCVYKVSNVDCSVCWSIPEPVCPLHCVMLPFLLLPALASLLLTLFCIPMVSLLLRCHHLRCPLVFRLNLVFIVSPRSILHISAHGLCPYLDHSLCMSISHLVSYCPSVPLFSR